MDSVKLIKKIGTVLNLKKQPVAECKNVWIVGDGAAILNNLDTVVTIWGAPEGAAYLAEFERFAKTGNFEASRSGLSANAFPRFPLFDGTELPAALFAESFAPYLDYVSDDICRAVLCSVGITHGGTVATDGHVLLADYARTLPEGLMISGEAKDAATGADVPNPLEEVILRRETVQVHAAILAAGETVQAVSVGHLPGSGEASCRWVRIETENCTIVSKLEEGPYPAWQNIVPAAEAGKGDTPRETIHVSAADVAVLRKAVKTLMPYSNETTRLSRLSGNCIRTYRAGYESPVEMVLPFSPFPETERAVNAELFAMVLSGIDCDIAITYLESVISAICIRHGSMLRMIMPLRILSVDDLPEDVAAKAAALVYQPLPCPSVAVKGKRPAAPAARSGMSKAEHDALKTVVADLDKVLARADISDQVRQSVTDISNRIELVMAGKI